MNFEYFGNTIETHTAGEPTRILLDAWAQARPGASVGEVRDWYAAERDWVRRALIQEPRGHTGMFGAVPTDASREDADLGIFFMDSGGYLDMCGHGTIGVVTALIETGRLQPAETIMVETPAGLVTTHPVVSKNGVETVRLQNVSSFVYDQVEVDIEWATDLPVSIVYAGNFFAMVDVRLLDLEIRRDDLDELVRAGIAIREAVNERVDVVNPLTGEPADVSLTEFFEAGNDVDRNVAVFANGVYDRSPCGTGTCAKMTLLYDAGELDVGETYHHESVIGTRFEGRIREVETVDGVTVTHPEIAGSAYVTGMSTFVLEPDDPVRGFTTRNENAKSRPVGSRTEGDRPQPK